jgi:filamentous hemagglutinin family protein
MVVQRGACRSVLCLLQVVWMSGLLIAAALVARSQAQNITLDGSLGGARGPLAGPNYMIPADVGQIRGGNLFHSFGRFTVQTGERATFTPPLNGTTIANILSRVTGGQRSDINGPLRSEIPGANLFLVNPAGVVFGPEASLHVSGSFHASTAWQKSLIGSARSGRPVSGHLHGLARALLPDSMTAPLRACQSAPEPPRARVRTRRPTTRHPMATCVRHAGGCGGSPTRRRGGLAGTPAARVARAGRLPRWPWPPQAPAR